MKTFELLQDLDAEVALQNLEEARRKRSKLTLTTSGSGETSGARNYVAKNMNLAGKGGAQKSKKGKGSYRRQKVNKNDY